MTKKYIGLERRENMKKKIDKFGKIAFVFIFVFIITNYFIKMLFFGEDVLNEAGNRRAVRRPIFSMESFENKSYQNVLERSLKDQIFLASTYQRKAQKFHNDALSVVLKPFRKKDDYNLVANDMYVFGNSDYLLYKRSDEYPTKNQLINVKKLSDQYEKVKVKNKYLYLVNSDSSIAFNHIDNAIFDEVNKHFPSFKKSYLKIDSYDTFKKYFYHNDHHWNYKGSYKGYTDILKMMSTKKEELKPLVPTEEITFPNISFYGSKNFTRGIRLYDEKLTVYNFDYPKYDVTVNDLDKNRIMHGYGEFRYYLANRNIKKNKVMYGNYYGWDFAEITFDFHKPNKQNLLIIGESDTNAINLLLACHFNKTHVIDLRHYPNFDINKYIKDHNIDSLLLVFNPITFESHDAFIEKEAK